MEEILNAWIKTKNIYRRFIVTKRFERLKPPIIKKYTIELWCVYKVDNKIVKKNIHTITVINRGTCDETESMYKSLEESLWIWVLNNISTLYGI